MIFQFETFVRISIFICQLERILSLSLSLALALALSSTRMYQKYSEEDESLGFYTPFYFLLIAHHQFHSLDYAFRIVTHIGLIAVRKQLLPRFDLFFRANCDATHIIHLMNELLTQLLDCAIHCLPNNCDKRCVTIAIHVTLLINASNCDLRKMFKRKQERINLKYKILMFFM